VDVVRAPIYAVQQGAAVAAAWPLLATATAGTLIGTLLGERVLFGLSPATFRRVVAVLVGALGIWLLWRA